MAVWSEMLYSGMNVKAASSLHKGGNAQREGKEKGSAGIWF